MIKKLLVFIVCIFSLQASIYAQAPGTTPCSALQLYPYTSCGNTSGMQYAGHYQTEMGDGVMVTMTGTSAINPACTTDNETTQSVEWLMVTATTTSFTITNLTDYTGPGAATAETRDYVIYSGACGSLTQIACSADIPRNGTVNVTGLTAGQNYYIMVSQCAAAFSGYPTANAVATCITSTVPHVASNNNCAGAMVLANNVTYTVTNSDSTADGPSVCQDPPSGSVENNVWYQWCAPPTWTPGQTAFLNINNQICNSTQGLQLSIYDAATTCAQITGGTATSLVCQNPGATTNYNYTFTADPNQCYLIVLDGFAGTACTYSIQVSATASTCVTPPTVTATAVTPTICPSGSTVLNAACSGDCTGITYAWSPATGLSGTTGASVTASPAVTTTYTVTGTTPTCTASATVTVTVNPLPTVTLTSAAATTNQTLCINTAITNITYATGGGATGATVSGLPAGVTGTFAAGVFTISGTPTASGTFNYTVTTTGGCTPAATATGTIVVNSLSAITLTSAAATTNQTLCVNTAITNITYSVGGSATGATVSGLPAGVTGVYAAGVFTISGTPTATGTFNYTVTTSGGCAPAATASGTIIVNPLPTITLTSAAATTNQTLCSNTAITNITYSVGGGATGATVSGLPSGVTGTYAAGVFTISGTPTASGTFNYTVTTTGGCAPAATATGTITVTPLPTVTLTSAGGTTVQVVCINTAITDITYSIGGSATGATVSGLPAGVTGTFAAGVFTISGTPTVSGTFNYTVTTTGGCAPAATATGTITVSQLPTVTLTSAPATANQMICVNDAITDITYAIGGGATGATVTGLPPNVTWVYAAGVVTISGTAVVSGIYGYTVSATTGGCPGAATATGTITVNPGPTIVLTSAAATTNQTLCINTAITDITYSIGGGATGATVSGLPTGVTGVYGAGVFTISGTPTVSGTFNYTVSTVGGCLPPATLSGTITVTPLITPTFTAVAPICTGDSLSALPTTSNNGITGTWSPALNNTATTVYTFTPTAGQCATTTTLTITVNPNVTPTFTAVAPICSGDSLSALPTTSNNGITGTWSPALDNTTTTVYTFTPTAGQCATTTTLTITVTPNVVPTFTAVAPICSGGSLSALPTTSNNGITGTWSPALDNTTTTVYTFTPTAGQCATTVTLTITVNPNVTPTFTAVAPICSGDSLSALPTTSNNGITGTWSPALNNTTTTVYTFTPTAGQCATTITLTITVNPNVTPTFTAVAPICSGGSLSALPTTSNNGITGTWSPALDNTTTTVYTFTPTAGQCATTTTLTIMVNPNVTPTFTAVAPICSGDTLSALPTTSNNGITGTWSPALDNTTTTVYTFTPTAGQCATTVTLTITVNPLPTAPTASVTTQPTCMMPTGTITITAPIGATFEYSVDGVTYQAGTVFSGLVPGTYNVTVRDTTTNCVSVATVLIINTAPGAPATPTASVTVQPTCTIPTGTIVVTAPTGATLEYSIDGVIFQTGTTFTGVAPGTYTVTVRDTGSGCSAAASVTVNPIPANPNAPTASATVQPTCITPTGTIVVTAPLGATLEYSIDGVTYQSSTTFTGLIPGTYNVTTTDTATGCVSSATAVTINPIPANPAAPTASVTVQPTCTIPTGTIVMTAPTGASLEYSIDGVTYQSSTTFTGVASGTYNVTVQDTATGCISAASSVTVNPIPANPSAPTASVTVQPTCTVTTGTIAITAPTGASLEYSIDGVTYQSSTTFTGVVSGTYNVTVHDSATGCISSATSVTVNPIPANPAAPTATVVSPTTCASPTGSITITAPTGATLEYSIDGVTYQSGTAFSSLVPGTYMVSVRDTSTGCVSATSTFTVDPAPGAPVPPTASATFQPNCTTPTGTIVITAPLGATLEYSVDGITYQSSTTFTGLASGSYDVGVRDTATGCLSFLTTVVINPIPANPNAPTATVTVQPTCITPTGTIDITAPTGATLEYSIDGATYQAATAFSGLVSGTYNVTVRDTATGCVSSATSVTIDPVPAAPSAPTASATVQPTCTIPTGTIEVTAPLGATLEYSIDGITYQTGTSFAGLTPNTYNVSVRDTATGCVSPATSVTVNPAPGTPSAATASVTVQPTCITTTGTIVITAPTGATLEYSIDGITYQPGTTFAGLSSGTYVITVRDMIAGCVSPSVSLTVDPLPANPAAPTASVTVQPTCSVPTGTIIVTAPMGASLEYSIDGTIYQATTSFAGLTPGTYSVTVRDNVTGCVSSAAVLTVDDVPSPVSVSITQGCIDNNYTLTALPFNSDYTYEWFNFGGSSIGTNNTVVVTAAGVYSVEVTTAEGCITTEPVSVITPYCEIPKGISPNGDTRNDSFDIAGLNATNVGIFNRYGVKVYSHGSGYTDQWHGQSDGGQELPDGTYYYVIDTAGGQTRTGWVYINRER